MKHSLSYLSDEHRIFGQNWNELHFIFDSKSSPTFLLSKCPNAFQTECNVLEMFVREKCL